MTATASPPMFGADSVIRRVSAEPALFAGAGRALLLQLAHPSVAQGVADHSSFQDNPFRRLQGTLEASFAIVFGTEELADSVGRRIRRIHDHVTGPTYRANDPENLLWVHATLLDTALGCYERLVEPLSAGDRDAYYQQMTRAAEVFGCPRDAQPADLAAFERYFADTVASLEVTDTGRRLARDVLWPRMPARLDLPLAPAMAVQRLVAAGTLPPRIREQFGLSWGRHDDRRLRLFEAAMRGAVRVTPRAVRTAPVSVNGRVLAWQAGRRGPGAGGHATPAA